MALERAAGVAIQKLAGSRDEGFVDGPRHKARVGGITGLADWACQAESLANYLAVQAGVIDRTQTPCDVCVSACTELLLELRPRLLREVRGAIPAWTIPWHVLSNS